MVVSLSWYRPVVEFQRSLFAALLMPVARVVQLLTVESFKTDARMIP